MAHILDVNFIKPFVEGTVETLKVQCRVLATVGKPYMKDDSNAEKMNTAIAGIIGITSAGFKGSISLCFPEKTFLGVMSRMLGETYATISKDVEDGAGELTNIIFGTAKRVLNEKGHSIQKAIPSVVCGAGLKVRHMTRIPTVVLPFDTELGPFSIEVGIEPA